MKDEIQQKEKLKSSKKTKKPPRAVPQKKTNVDKKKCDQPLTSVQCRLCFKCFYSKEKRFTVSYAVTKIFKDFTGMELSLKKTYPRKMCTACDQNLRNFVMLRQELIREQKKFYASVGFYAQGEERDSFFGYASPEKDIDIKEEKQDIFILQENQLIDIKEEKDELPIVTIQTTQETMENIDVYLPTPAALSESDHGKHFNLRPRIKSMKSKYPFKKDKKLTILVRCPHCSELTESLYKHRRDMHNLINWKYTCDICNFTTTKRTTIVDHIKQESDRSAGIGKSAVTSGPIPRSKRGLCNHCGKFITNIKLHLNVVLKKTKFYCDLCSYIGYRKEAIQSHIDRRHAKGKNIPCDQCHRKFKFQNDLRKHKDNSHAPRVHSCTFCKGVYCSKALLKRHIASQHIDPKRYTCKFCDSVFKRSSQLSYHQNKHLDNRKYKCQECSERFNVPREFYRHGCIKELRFSCEAPGCSSLLTRIDNYRAHVKKHTNISEKEKGEMLDKAKRIQDSQIKIRYIRDN